MSSNTYVAANNQIQGKWGWGGGLQNQMVIIEIWQVLYG